MVDGRTLCDVVCDVMRVAVAAIGLDLAIADFAVLGLAIA